MADIVFRTIVDDDRLIRPPTGVVLPTGEVEVTVRPMPSTVENGDSLASMKAWLLEAAAEAERLRPTLPADLAEHHDHYAHHKPLP